MSVGVIFEVREFSLFDGPGIRTTVFMKGCPLRCRWCHNPEGLSPKPEILFAAKNCVGCGVCRTVCPKKEGAPCAVCGRCAENCPARAKRLCGREIDSAALAAELAAMKDVFGEDGGVTFSGGEPLAQTAFLVETARLLRADRIDTALETSGYASSGDYRAAAAAVDLVYQDVKHPDGAAHRRYTGVSNRPILENLAWLKSSGRPFVVRIPLIPTVNDAPETLEQIAALLTDSAALRGVEILSYHADGGGKYALLGQEPPEVFPQKTPGSETLEPFLRRGLSAKIL